MQGVVTEPQQIFMQAQFGVKRIKIPTGFWFGEGKRIKSNCELIKPAYVLERSQKWTVTKIGWQLFRQRRAVDII